MVSTEKRGVIEIKKASVIDEVEKLFNSISLGTLMEYPGVKAPDITVPRRILEKFSPSQVPPKIGLSGGI